MPGPWQSSFVFLNGFAVARKRKTQLNLGCLRSFPSDLRALLQYIVEEPVCRSIPRPLCSQPGPPLHLSQFREQPTIQFLHVFTFYLSLDSKLVIVHLYSASPTKKLLKNRLNTFRTICVHACDETETLLFHGCSPQAHCEFVCFKPCPAYFSVRTGRRFLFLEATFSCLCSRKSRLFFPRCFSPLRNRPLALGSQT